MAKELLLRRGTTAENDLFTGALAEPSYDTERKELRVHDGITQGGKIISLPVGMIAQFGGATAPKGWLICDGSAVSRVDYADLFAVIGTIYGNGDGVSTFNLPELFSYTGAVIGNGTRLGVNNDGYLKSQTETLGSQVGWVRSYNSGGALATLGEIEITADPTKSGIECQKSSVIVCIKC